MRSKLISARKATKQEGFTLLELMFVVTIAGILVTLAQPSFQQSIIKARETALKHSLFVIRDVIDQYRSDKGKYPTTLHDLVAGEYVKRLPVDPFTRSSQTWQEMTDEVEGGVSDIHSGSPLVSLEGSPYNHW